MSSKAMADNAETGAGTTWQPPSETAPSATRVDEPTLGRVIGFIGLMCLALGGTALGLSAAGWSRGIGSFWGSIFSIIGVACLLFHALCDGEVQVRRVYGLVGFLWVIAAIVITALPIKGESGSHFLPYGYGCLILGLLFLLPFARHETDPRHRRAIQYTLGGGGAALALVGFLFGSVLAWFLLPYGVLLALLGLAYLWAFIGIVGSTSEIGFRAGLGMGVAGVLVFLVALARSAFAGVTESYFIPNGLVLIAMGVLYAMFSAGICLDNRQVVLTRRELASFFFSPIAYFVLLGLTLVGWIFFVQFIWTLEEQGSSNVPLIEPIVRYYLVSWIPIICVLFVIPVLTMRLLSEEQRTGTLEVLLTAPLGELSVVLSKFIAVWLFYLILWLPWGLFLVGLRAWSGEPFEYRPLLTFYIMLACTGANFVAMGLFFSSLTRNQIIAAVLTFAGMLLWPAIFLLRLFLEDSRNTMASSWVPILNHMSFIDLWLKALDGVLTPHLLLFHITAAVFWLFLTVKVLESRKWR